MWQDLNGGRCSMGDACSNPPEAEGVYKMIMKNFERHYTTNRAPFGLYYHAAWFTQPHHKEGFIQFLDAINSMKDVFIITNWQALQWVRDPTPLSRINSFTPFQCNYAVSRRCRAYRGKVYQAHTKHRFNFHRVVRSVATTRRYAICGTSRACATCAPASPAPTSTRGPARRASARPASTTTSRWPTPTKSNQQRCELGRREWMSGKGRMGSSAATGQRACGKRAGGRIFFFCIQNATSHVSLKEN